MTSQPLVSVVLRTRNRPWYLRQAMEGLASQTLRDFEALVINDGGKDVSEIVAAFEGRVPCRYFHHRPGRGRCAAANRGLAEATGKYIAYLDDDDMYFPDHLEALVTCLEEQDAAVAYSNAYEVIHTPVPSTEEYEEVSREVKLDFDFNRGRFFIQSYIHIVTLMHAKKCTEKVGGFDEWLDVLEDLDLYFRLSQKYDFIHIPRITAEYRIRDDESNAVTALIPEFQKTQRELYSKYVHMIVPEIFKYTRHKDGIVTDLMQRVEALERRLKELEG